MSDAAEVLNAIYDSLGLVRGGTELVTRVFGLSVHEAVHCEDCGKDTHQGAYTQFFYNVSATGLRLQAIALDCGDQLPSLVRLSWESWDLHVTLNNCRSSESYWQPRLSASILVMCIGGSRWSMLMCCVSVAAVLSLKFVSL